MVWWGMWRQAITMIATMTAAMVMVAACQSLPRYRYKPVGNEAPETELPEVEARVVTAREAEQSGLVPRWVSLPFATGRDGTEVVSQFFENADREGARLISELAIILETTRDGRPLECRTELVPEAVTETQRKPGWYRTVPVQQPVQRTVTEQRYRCKPVTRSELRSHTAHEQRCGMKSHPVTRTRTVYTSQYDYFSKSTRSVPRTESYTTYESRYECQTQPVTRMRSEMVTKHECSLEPVTTTVTRYEFQFESRYVPPHMETLTRQRLRELEPVCYEVDGGGDDPSLTPPGRTRGNRIEGRIFTRR